MAGSYYSTTRTDEIIEDEDVMDRVQSKTRTPDLEPPDPFPWMEFAACSLETSELFFPDRITPEGRRKVQALCDSCPVSDECPAAYKMYGFKGEVDVR